MTDTELILGATADGIREALVLKRANRHGLIAGATGTGKTVTLQGLAENFSAAGVPVFVADVKGDLSGIAMAGSATAKPHAAFTERAAAIGDSDWQYRDTPVVFWDLFGEAGHPIRATVSEMGPVLLGRMLNLNDVQDGVLTIAFHVADEEGLLLLDLDDLQAMLAHCAERADDLTTRYGNVSKQSVGAIQRALLQLRGQGGDRFFGEPALDLADFMRVADDGRGVVSVLAADKLMASPRLYATFLLWLLSELFETLPEVGDPDKPKLVFFFDEAHLLFDDAPDALVDKVEQVVRLIRSKGVGIYFVTQNPIDIPDAIAGQLGNRVQHALRAFTPKEARAIKAAAETFRPNPKLDVAQAITELKTGEALVSVLQADGSPSPVERTLIRPPRSRVGPVTPAERGVLMQTDAVGDRYDTAIDRESAAELLGAKANEAAAAAAASKAQAAADKEAALKAKEDARLAKEAERQRIAEQRVADREAREAEKAARAADREAANNPWNRATQSATRSAGSAVGRIVVNEIGKQVFGTTRGGRAKSGGLVGGLLRGVLGGLFRG
ncbi:MULTISPECIES: helicase HerA-like domain-containing protein [unclassified Sphingomonas]|uniref:helicase HerA-like domain-containing protein n=1 Tax=unclassified Sphingomonas TaxID=196159 RepID=UPI000700BB85|nr:MULTISPECIES: helicase HerA-like domain-containing protein [unclassified Sphingomonas]KQM26674.1 ATP-binding protein [Sphingomonas sp. Leaf9]KQM43079.1 ATP-binding protein [Sphingomonas sp. Leaf11]